jgi:hypothetical protein
VDLLITVLIAMVAGGRGRVVRIGLERQGMG